jgi:Zn-dependent M16 (insulinase) family peptidase
VAKENKDVVLKAIRDTFDEVIAKGFDPRRIEAIIHQTELSLKNKGSSFGLNLIMSLTALWNNNPEDPIQHLQINRNIEKFRKELADNPKFLQLKVKEYFVDNTHQVCIIVINTAQDL